MTGARRSRSTEAFFGRRHGKTLRAGQQAAVAALLPGLGIDLSAPPPVPLAALFSAPVEEEKV